MFDLFISTKIDLDNVISSWLVWNNVKKDNIKFIKLAPEDKLQDSNIICIECGGSGETNLMNFDHHIYNNKSTFKESRCAAKQIFEEYEFLYKMKYSNNRDCLITLTKLIEYVNILDVRGPHILRTLSTARGPYLTDVFGGIAAFNHSLIDRLTEGVNIIDTLVMNNIDPYGPMDQLIELNPKYKNYVEVKKKNKHKSITLIQNIELFFSSNNRIIGYISTAEHMDISPIYNSGVSIMIIHNPDINKFTVCSKNTKLDSLMPLVSKIEDGWGGPENKTMICSPKDGTCIDSVTIKEFIRKGF